MDSSAINIATSPVAVKVKVNGGSIKVWLDDSLKIDASDGNAGLPDGGVAFAEVTSLDDLKIGYDTECDQGGSMRADDDGLWTGEHKDGGLRHVVNRGCQGCWERRLAAVRDLVIILGVGTRSKREAELT